MKKLLLSSFLCLFFYCIHAQSNNTITIGKIDSIDSKILNEKRAIWIYDPGGDTQDIFSKQNYPVVYLLDGDAHFYSVVGMIHQLSSVNGNTICPKMMVVGIPNTNRTRDLTPTKASPQPPFADSSMVANSGGGDNFISFIEKELIPYIESNYTTVSYRTFIGHSLGGLTVMNTLIHKPDLFNAYVAIDPSMWWDNQNLLKEIESTKIDEKYSGKSLYLGIANTMAEGMDTLSVQKDTTSSTEHIRSILELNAYLNKQAKSQINYQGKYYDQDDHGSVPLIAEYDAFRFIFDFYRLKLDMQDYMNPDSDLFTKVVNHYQGLSEVFGRETKPEEAFVNSLGYQFLSMQQHKKSEHFFKLNVTNYPESFNAYDSLGDFYAATGQKEKAIKNYKKSISLNKDSFSKDKLKDLEKE